MVDAGMASSSGLLGSKSPRVPPSIATIADATITMSSDAHPKLSSRGSRCGSASSGAPNHQRNGSRRTRASYRYGAFAARPATARAPVGRLAHVPDAPSNLRTDTASIVIPAPADAIYAAFADPDALMNWLPPANMTGRALEYEFRKGGRYRIELTYADASSATPKTTAQSDVTTGRFLALDPSRRIVQSVVFESSDASFGGEMIMTWSFEAAPGGTLVTVTAERVPPGIGPEDHEVGMRSSLQNLSRYLQRAR
jgi:uncharacterized protein YndB with AHSA1/START domain